MKILRSIFFILLPTFIMLVFGTGCSSRMDQSVQLDDSTLIFPPKDTNGVNVNITLYRDWNKKAKSRIGEGVNFTLMEKTRIQADVEIKSGIYNLQQDRVFHFDWIDPEGKSLYIKRDDLLAGDSTRFLNSSISASTEKRKPGNYKLRVYLYRELIAEKMFYIYPAFMGYNDQGDQLQSTITLFRSISKKTGKLIGRDTVFTRKKKRKLRTYVNLENRADFGQRELRFIIAWQGPDGNSIYKKKIDLQTADTTSTLYSSISISPESRPAGEYQLKVFLFDVLIKQQKFFLE